MTSYEARLALDVCALLIDGSEEGRDGAYQTYGNGVKCLFCDRPLMTEKSADGHKALCPMRKVYELKSWAETAADKTEKPPAGKGGREGEGDE